jgi:ribonuclease BN (tRNA processing enzyme)
MCKVSGLFVLCAGLCAASTDVVILGSGTPRADPDRSGPAVAVIYHGKSYLFDSGPGIVRRAAAASTRLGIEALKMPNLQTVFLTHLHSDHTLGLPDLIFSPWVLHRTAPLEIYGPKGTQAMVDNIEAAWAQDIDIRIHGLEHGNTTGYKANVHEIELGVLLRENGLEISAFSVHHGSWAQAFGYRIKTPDKTIVISGDCSPSPAVIEACNGCDVLLHEVYAMSELKVDQKGWPEYLHQFHTSTEELGKIAVAAKPKALVLYHQIMRGVTDAQLVEEVKTSGETKVFSARDFDVY